MRIIADAPKPLVSFRALGAGPLEEFRCRIYDGVEVDHDAERVDFLEKLAGPGVVDCEAIDERVAAMQARGWLPEKPELEPNPDGEGRIGRWRMTDRGRAEWLEIQRNGNRVDQD